MCVRCVDATDAFPLLGYATTLNVQNIQENTEIREIALVPTAIEMKAFPHDDNFLPNWNGCSAEAGVARLCVHVGDGGE